MLPRVVVAFIVAVCVGGGTFFTQERGTTLVVQMSSTSPGLVQVFYDIGAGFSEHDSAQTKLVQGLSEYRLPLPSGTYRSIRFDPGTAPGIYDIRNMSIVDGGETITIPLNKLHPAYQLTVLDSSKDHLRVQCPEGGYDPQTIFIPEQPLMLGTTDPLVRSLLLRLFFTFGLAIAAIALVERAPAPVGPFVRTRLNALLDFGTHTWAVVGRRVPLVILALILTLCVDAGIFVAHERGRTFVVQMSSTSPGWVQVFYDVGAGFNDNDSSKAMILPGLSEYRLPLPSGTFRSIRFDPGTLPGIYDIRSVSIIDSGETTAIPLSKLRPAYQLTALDSSEHRLLVQCPEGAYDPQTIFIPESPIVLGAKTPLLWSWSLRLFGMFGLVMAVVAFAARALTPIAPLVRARLDSLSSFATHRPGWAIVAVSACATIVSTYPVLFLGRSLVSPNDSGTAMLYDSPPFVPGSTDNAVEDTRSSDTGAMMWAFLPYAKMERNALARGEMPFWDRNNSAGISLWGQGQSFLPDPLHWLALLPHDPGVGMDAKFVAHRFVFACGIGAAALLGGAAAVPSLAAAAMAPFLGLFTHRFNHPAAFSITYAPWILVGWFLLARALSTRREVRAALFLACASVLTLVAGPPKEAVVLILGCQCVGALTILMTPSTYAIRARKLGLAALAGVGTILLTAPHWLIFMDTLHASWTIYDIPLINFAGAPQALAFVLGNLTPGPVSTGVNIAVVALAGSTLAFPSKLWNQPPAFACSVTAIAAIAAAFGAIPADVLLRIPLIANIHHIDETLSLVALVLMLVAAAFGIELLMRARWRVTVLLTGLAFAGAWLTLSTLEKTVAIVPLQGSVVAVVLLLAALLPLAMAEIGRQPTRVLPPIVATLTVIVLVLPSGMHAETGIDAIDRFLPQPRLRAPLDRNSPAIDVLQKLIVEPTRVSGTGQFLFSGTQTLYGLEGIGGPDALRLDNYERLLGASGLHREWGWHATVLKSTLPQINPILDLLNVGFLLVPPDEVPSDVTPPALPAKDRVEILPRPSAWPRAFFVDHAIEYANVPEFLALLSERRGPIAAVQHGDEKAGTMLGLIAIPGAPALPAHGYTLTPNTTTFSVTAPRPGIAVLTESFMPNDFIVTLNGAPAPYFRVNHAFKGVYIPRAGEWQVRFQYRPARWNRSLLLAAAGLAILVALGAVGRRPRVRQIENPAARASL